MRMRLLLLVPVVALLCACGRQSEEAKAPAALPAPPQQAAPAPPAAAGDKAETKPAAPQVNITSAAPPPPPPALASGRIKDFDWRLTKVKVTGAILTVEFEGDGKCCSSELLQVSEVSYIDDSTAKKYSVLKDEGGQWMAAPLVTPGRAKIGAQGGVTKTWFKFPAPPPEAKTVSINMSSLGTLDGIPVQR